jgi:hypothetical protein
MSWLHRLAQRLDRGTDDRGARLEAAGRLDEAFAAYREAGRHEDAARILMARAEAEPDLVQRKVLLNVVLTHAPTGSQVALEAARRRALVSLQILRATAGSGVSSDAHLVAVELEQAGLLKEAAEAFGLAGDTDGQTRALAACGAIDALESTFEEERKRAAARRERETVCKIARDLDVIGRRREALARCKAWLEQHPRDEEIASFTRTVEQRLVRPGALRVELDNRPVTIVVDKQVIIGRSDASICIRSPAVSRRHLVVRHQGSAIVVEDAGSRNGTTLAGSRISGPLPVGSGIEVVLGGQVPVRIEPWRGGGAAISVSGQVFLAPFGPLPVGPFAVDRCGDVMTLSAEASGAPPVLNGLTCDMVVDLCLGDEIRSTRDGPVLLKVIAP